VEIAEGVTSIGNMSFFESGFSTINIPSTVSSIDGDAFEGCHDLKKIYVNQSYDEMNSMHKLAPWGAVNAEVIWLK
jgi:hypothetical protein